MYRSARAIASLLLAFTSLCLRAEPVDLGSPSCPAHFQYAAGKCTISDPELAKLKAPDDCTDFAGLKNEGGVCKRADKTPVPQCQAVAGGNNVLKDGKCMFDAQASTSASGDYVGDKFTIVGVPAADPDRFGGGPGTQLKVLSQKSLGDTDKELTLVKVQETGERNRLGLPIDKVDGPVHRVKASELIEYGATRQGWTYGALALPYKYYPRSKNFGSGVSVGPYAGYRKGRPGSAWTVALAATIGSVKGEVRDDAENVTSNPDLMAYSVAGGFMWDISKAQGVKPFKIGLFLGVDTVSTDDKVKFRNNRKPWLAFQIGFDFTDN